MVDKLNVVDDTEQERSDMEALEECGNGGREEQKGGKMTQATQDNEMEGERDSSKNGDQWKARSKQHQILSKTGKNIIVFPPRQGRISSQLKLLKTRRPRLLLP